MSVFNNPMTYKRTFRISAAHFNSQGTYNTVWAIERDKTQRLDGYAILALLGDNHGHNFVIDVDIAGSMPNDGSAWLVDDQLLSDLVMAWDGFNLSTHDDFLKQFVRATTENMCRILARKIACMLDEAGTYSPYTTVRVTVHETPDIYARFQTALNEYNDAFFTHSEETQ